MQTDFFNAFRRHLRDAEYLYDDSRWPNADQLYAYSAECGLKCLMKQFGMLVDPVSGDPRKQDRLHADEIWNRYEAYRAGRGVAGYELPQTNPFGDWNINQRYAHEVDIDQARVDPHKNCALMVKNLIQKAVLEGRLII